MTARFLVAGLAAVATVLSLGTADAAGQKKIRPEVCADCHEAIDMKTFGASIHGGLECIDCHVNGPFGEHDEENIPKVDCGTCHEEPVKDYTQSYHGLALARGSEHAPNCNGCHGSSHYILSSDDPKSLHGRANVPAMCAKCHADTKIVKKYDIPVADPFSAYKNSVHGRALAAGNTKAAVCSDCHGSHTIQPGRELTSKTSKQHLPKTCGRCHSDVLKEYEGSIHGQSVLKGNTDSPTCSDCHGEHGIFERGDPDSPLSATNLATKTCGHCHQDLTLARRYGFDSSRTGTYLQSYHGLAVRRGSLTVANCSSCHGVHNIRPSSDPLSTIHPNKLTETCGSCHPGATAAFTNVPVHLQTSPTANPILHYARWLYLWMILVTIGGMFGHNLLVWIAAIVEKIRAQRAMKTYKRFTTIQLVMHGMLLTSFMTLVITGFGLRYPEALWTRVLEWVALSEEVRRILHRTAAIVMLASGVLHIVHGIVTRRGRMEVWEMLPRLSDIREFRQYVVYHILLLFGRAKKTDYPKMGRYTYIHKAEYWALIWGTVVMTVTGFALWFPEIFSRYLPVWGIPLAELIHLYEAWLATLAIVVWHFFFVIFHPHEYPMSVIWLTGKVTKEEMEHEHPRELEKGENL